VVDSDIVDMIKEKIDLPKRMVDQILSQEILIQGVDILKDLSKQYPNEPYLIRMYADSLSKAGISELPVEMYEKSASLYLKKDKIITAIATKFWQWQICMPTAMSVKNFFLDLKKHAKKNTLVNQFFVRLTLHEFMALFANFKVKQFEPGSVIKKVGGLEETLWFVVSGTLKDSIFMTVDNNERQYRKPTKHLTEGDYFGDIYPFDQIKKSKSYIEAITSSELIGISKNNLALICEQYPNVELGILSLLQIRSNNVDTRAPEKLRMEKRINIRLDFDLEIFLNTSSETSIYLSGFSKDISIGGICILLDEISMETFSEIPVLKEIFNNAVAQVNFKIENLIIKIPGKIRWSKPILDNGRKTIAVGIQFEKLSPKLKGFLLSFFNCFERK